MQKLKETYLVILEDYKKEEALSTGKLGLFEWGIFLVTCLSLVVMNFTGTPSNFLWLSQHIDVVPAEYWELGHLCLWVLSCFLGFVCIPIIFLKLTKRSLADYYLGLPKGQAHWTPYIVCLIPVSLIVVWVSYWPDFQAIYPFYSLAGRSWFDLIAWELAYGLQFFALEFFFRAFLLESLRKALGYGAIAFMLVPYCMIHFPKTAAESLGSVVAGLILGYLAMKGRSIWGGVLVHWFIAVEMDVLSLIQTGKLP